MATPEAEYRESSPIIATRTITRTRTPIDDFPSTFMGPIEAREKAAEADRKKSAHKVESILGTLRRTEAPRGIMRPEM